MKTASLIAPKNAADEVTSADKTLKHPFALEKCGETR